MNLPNWISVGRIALAPLVAWLPFVPSATLRGLAFVLYLILAISDHYDGKIAREQQIETNLGRLLDPLADKIFLLATFIPMYMLQSPPGEWLVRLLPRVAEGSGYAFVMWGGAKVPLPWWILLIVLGREAAMTVFRHAANRKGIVIAAIGPGKAKAAFQYIWLGAAYFWFAYRTWIDEHGFTGMFYRQLQLFNGFIGTVSMIIAVVLTVWSFVVYVRRYGSVLR